MTLSFGLERAPTLLPPSWRLFLSLLAVLFLPPAVSPHSFSYIPHFPHPHWPEDKEYLSTALTLQWTSPPTIALQARINFTLSPWESALIGKVSCCVLSTFFFLLFPFPCHFLFADEIRLGSLPRLKQTQCFWGPSLFRWPFLTALLYRCLQIAICTPSFDRDIDQLDQLGFVLIVLFCCKKGTERRKLASTQIVAYVRRSFTNSPCAAQQWDSVNWLLFC